MESGRGDRATGLRARVCAALAAPIALFASACVPSAESQAARRDVTIRIAAHYNAKQVAPLLACFRRYEATHPGIRVEYQQVSYEDFFQTVMISRAGRAPVDIYNLYSIWAPQMIGTGALAPPPADIDRFVRAAYNPSTVNAATVKGRLWGIPSAVSIYQLVYNKRLLAAAGFTAPPKNWAELFRTGAAITRKNRQGNILIAGYAFGPQVSDMTHTFYSYMYAAGVAPYTPDLRATNLTSPTAIRILTNMSDLFQRGITSNSVVELEFPKGSVGMAVIANWQKESLSTALGDRFANTVGVAPIPTDGPGGTMIYSFFWGVDAASPSKRQAWDLLRWLNAPQGEAGLSCTGTMLQGVGELTGNRADLVAMGPSITDAFSAPFVTALRSPGAASQPNLWHAEEIDRLLKYYIGLSFAGRMTPTAALTAADTQIRQILAEQP